MSIGPVNAKLESPILVILDLRRVLGIDVSAARLPPRERLTE